MSAMRLPTTIAALLLATSVLAFAYKTETLQELIARAGSAKLDDQPALFTDIAERQLKSADELYSAGKSDDGSRCSTRCRNLFGKSAELSHPIRQET